MKGKLISIFFHCNAEKLTVCRRRVSYCICTGRYCASDRLITWASRCNDRNIRILFSDFFDKRRSFARGGNIKNISACGYLIIIIAVYRTGSITKAAKELYMTQPAVTRAIREMERYYGVLLFERINQRLSVTEAGIRLYSYALHITDSFEHSDGIIKGFYSSLSYNNKENLYVRRLSESKPLPRHSEFRRIVSVFSYFLLQLSGYSDTIYYIKDFFDKKRFLISSF